MNRFGQWRRPVPLHHKGGIELRQIVARKDDIHDRTPDGLDNADGDTVDGHRCGCQVLFGFTHTFTTLRAKGAAIVIVQLYDLTCEPALICVSSATWRRHFGNLEKAVSTLPRISARCFSRTNAGKSLLGSSRTASIRLM